MQTFYEWARRRKSFPQDYKIEKPGEAFDTDEHGRPDAIPAVQAEAQTYNLIHGLPPIDHDTYVKVDQQRAGRIADAYDALPMDDHDNPLVISAYAALAREVAAQWAHAIAHGMTFEPMKGDDNVYAKGDYDIDEVFHMVKDVRNNRHMAYFTGGEPNVFMAKVDPNTKLPVNDMFRAIHDYFGHCAMGADFGPRGEENAWVSHSQMFTKMARRALTVETRGQNCWVNFGHQNYDAAGNYKNILPAKRPFATQKCAVFSGADDWINSL